MNKERSKVIEKAYLTLFNQVFREFRSAGYDESLSFDHAKFQADEFIRLTLGVTNKANRI